MSDTLWEITEHIIPASHIRGYSGGVRNPQTDHLRLAVKQYVPRGHTHKPGDATIIMAHGVGSSKECYEPFFNCLLTQSNFPIRAVWAADAAHHGASYLLNEDIIGDEHHWFDSSRDLLQMVNYFQTQMPPPIYGIGQSWGCVTITMMSVFHPRLFAGFVNIEPTFATGFGKADEGLRPRQYSAHRASLMAKRRDRWRSREEARKQFLAGPYYRLFDPEVFERVMKYDLRDSPTPEYPEAVTLTTPKSLEVATMMMPDPPYPGRESGPDHVPEANNVVVPGFYRGEVEEIQIILPRIYPSVLYVWGTKSDIGMSDYASRQVNRTGIAKGGNGGVASGKVRSATVERANHPVVLEKPRDTAKVVSIWLNRELDLWNDEARRMEKQPILNPGILNPHLLKRLAKI